MNINIIKETIYSILNFIYRQTISRKVRKLRKKNIISVLYILNDLSKWKTESLYLEMCSNSRFNPIIGVTIQQNETPSASSRKVLQLIEYLNWKGYHYIELGKTFRPSPDIVIYIEPYGSAVPFKQSIYSYWKSVFISINYSCHTTHIPEIDYKPRLFQCAWIDCYESPLAIQDAYKYIGSRRKNIKHTGLPISDILLKPNESNPWKKQSSTKKKIIWAPHHTIGLPGEVMTYGNFLRYYQFMLQMAEKYKDYIQIAFKPHPRLRQKLELIWGYENTEKYYNIWSQLENGQLSEGNYYDLFKCSDAMIHDSSSFIVEYLHVNKPVMFLIKNKIEMLNDMNTFGKNAFKMQEYGNEEKEIENFIQRIIQGKDIQLNNRTKFIEQNLIPPNNRSASQNIIDLIIGGIDHETKK